MLHVKSARYISGHRLWVSFDNGTAGEIDLANQLKGPVFEPLSDPEFFARLAVDPDLETVVWPNGADLAPEYLFERLQATSRL